MFFRKANLAVRSLSLWIKNLKNFSRIDSTRESLPVNRRFQLLIFWNLETIRFCDSYIFTFRLTRSGKLNFLSSKDDCVGSTILPIVSASGVGEWGSRIDELCFSILALSLSHFSSPSSSIAPTTSLSFLIYSSLVFTVSSYFIYLVSSLTSMFAGFWSS